MVTTERDVQERHAMRRGAAARLSSLCRTLALPLTLALTLAMPLALGAARVAQAAPLGTDFTYQGRLDLSGSPVSGTADFQFKLFAAASGGTQVGSTVVVTNVTVSDGAFSVNLDFGATAFEAGEERWLELIVRSPAGSGSFVTLAPRQEITAAPFALEARGVDGHSLDASNGGPTDALLVDTAGNVGIGTTAPATRLHVKGVEEGIRVQGPATGSTNLAWVGFNDASGTRIGYVGDGSSGDTGTFLASDLGDVILHTLAGRSLVVKPDGKVGIGTTTPTAKLDVRGDIRLGPTGQYRATSGEENLRLLRGNIDGTGAIDAGAGFTCTRTSEGQYTIVFTTPFAGVPSVTATPFSVSIEPRVAEIKSLTASSFHVAISFVGNPETDSDWSFCVIGPR
ncbi:MAG: hypothetical protein IT349_07695 [Candidatus Eisenbacteria bacterium]|nr:hypothetical protein [Candidatus Eisenbacteria bacterium]